MISSAKSRRWRSISLIGSALWLSGGLRLAKAAEGQLAMSSADRVARTRERHSTHAREARCRLGHGSHSWRVVPSGAQAPKGMRCEPPHRLGSTHPEAVSYTP